MKNFKLIPICFLFVFCSSKVMAEEREGLILESNKTTSQETEELSDGTIKDGPLKNMRLPAMTMLFKLHEAKYMKGLKVGDDIFFKAEGNMRIIYLEKK